MAPVHPSFWFLGKRRLSFWAPDLLNFAFLSRCRRISMQRRKQLNFEFCENLGLKITYLRVFRYPGSALRRLQICIFWPLRVSRSGCSSLQRFQRCLNLALLSRTCFFLIGAGWLPFWDLLSLWRFGAISRLCEQRMISWWLISFPHSHGKCWLGVHVVKAIVSVE